MSGLSIRLVNPVVLTVIFTFTLLPASALARIPKAYWIVAERHQIPAAVFYSVVLQESGMTRKGRFHPWPWTLNVDHTPYRYETREEAEAALADFMVTNHRIAVGLGQIYLPSHGHRFRNPVGLLDPRLNLEYAAHLLALEYQWTHRNGGGNWWTAAGRYHAPSNPTAAADYRRRVYGRCLKLALPCEQYGVLI
jgi:hypothetical protein